MGYCKDMWVAEAESICTRYAIEELTHEQAASRLAALGFDWGEACDMLDEARS